MIKYELSDVMLQPFVFQTCALQLLCYVQHQRALYKCTVTLGKSLVLINDRTIYYCNTLYVKCIIVCVLCVHVWK